MKNKLNKYIFISIVLFYGCKKDIITDTNHLNLGEAVILYNSSISKTNDSSEFIYNFSFLEIKGQKLLSKSPKDSIIIEQNNSFEISDTLLHPVSSTLPKITSHIMLFNSKDSRRIYFESTGVFLQNYINTIKQYANFKLKIGYWNGNNLNIVQNDTNYMHTFYDKTYIEPYKYEDAYDVSKNDNNGINYIQKDELLEIINQAIDELDNSLSRKAITLVNYSTIDPSVNFQQLRYDSLIARLKASKTSLNIITYQSSPDLHRLVFSTGGFICASYQDHQNLEDPSDEKAYFNQTIQPSNVAIQNLHQILLSKPSKRIKYYSKFSYYNNPLINGNGFLKNTLLNVRYKNINYNTFPKLN